VLITHQCFVANTEPRSLLLPTALPVTRLRAHKSRKKGHSKNQRDIPYCVMCFAREAGEKEDGGDLQSDAIFLVTARPDGSCFPWSD